MALPLTPATKLDAVNQMLASIGQSPVNSLDVAGIRDVAIAKLALDNVTLQVLNRGWSFNTDYEYELRPNQSNNILVPSNALFVDPTYRHDDYVIRDNDGQLMLYDRQNKTFEIEKPVKCTIIWAYDFEQLPSVARTYIATRAARVFQSQVLGSDILFRFTELHEREALADLKRLEARQKTVNVLHTNVSTNRIFTRRVNPPRW